MQQIFNALFLLVIPGLAAGESIYKIEKNDYIILSITGIGWAGTQARLHDFVEPNCPCDKTDINSFDRSIAGHYDKTWNHTGDIGVAAAILAPFPIIHQIKPDGLYSSDALPDLTVIAESVLISGFTNQLVKLLIQRPRPFLYSDSVTQEQLDDHDSYLSFYSAHTSTSFAALTASAYTYSAYFPESRISAYGMAVGLASLIGYSRVRAGKHFPTDVLTGAILGTAIGLLVPWLHTKDNLKLDISTDQKMYNVVPTLQVTKIF